MWFLSSVKLCNVLYSISHHVATLVLLYCMHIEFSYISVCACCIEWIRFITCLYVSGLIGTSHFEEITGLVFSPSHLLLFLSLASSLTIPPPSRPSPPLLPPLPSPSLLLLLLLSPPCLSLRDDDMISIASFSSAGFPDDLDSLEDDRSDLSGSREDLTGSLSPRSHSPFVSTTIRTVPLVSLLTSPSLLSARFLCQNQWYQSSY